MSTSQWPTRSTKIGIMTCDRHHPTAFATWAHRNPDWTADQVGRRREHVKLLAKALRDSGIDLDVDLYHEHESINWNYWGPQRISEVEWVIVICSQAWKNAWENKGDVTINTGAKAEIDVIRDIQGSARDALEKKVRLVLLPGESRNSVPLGMGGIPHTTITEFSKAGVEELVRSLTNQPLETMPPLGPVPTLPANLTNLADFPSSPGTGDSPIGSAAEAEAEMLRAQLEALPAATDDAKAPGSDERERVEQRLQQLTSDPQGGGGSQAATADPPVETDLTSTQQMRRQFMRAQRANHLAEVDVYTAWGENTDRAHLVAVLEQGARTGLIASTGLRSPLGTTDLHLGLGLEDSTPVIGVEDDGGAVLSRVIWRADMSAVAVFQTLSDQLEELDRHPGPHAFDPFLSMEEAAEALAYAADYRSHRNLSGSEYLVDIVEYVDHWFVTERGLVCRGREYYYIAASRYDHMDWEQHILDKGWDGVGSALRVAKALNGTARDQSSGGSLSSAPLEMRESILGKYGPTAWLNRQDSNGPELLIRAAHFTRGPLAHVTRSTSISRGLVREDREARLLDLLRASTLTQEVKREQQEWHWLADMGWNILGGSGSADLTTASLGLIWADGSLRDPFEVRSAVLSGTSVQEPARPAMVTAVDIGINVLELDASRRRAGQAYRSGPIPAPAALTLEELYRLLRMASESAASIGVQLADVLVPEPRKGTDCVALWLQLGFGTRLEQVVDLRGFKRLPGALYRSGHAEAAHWRTTDIAFDAEPLAKELLTELLESLDYRHVRATIELLR